MEEDEVPDALLCPISHTLFHDPVCLTSGHTYELSSILKFWEGRPLANPIGGTGSGACAAQMIINFNMRAQVDAFLQGKRESVPIIALGWSSSRGARTQAHPGGARRIIQACRGGGGGPRRSECHGGR